MADFNPQLPKADNTDDLINKSRGATPLQAKTGVKSGQAFSTLLEGLGNIVTQTVDTFDIGIRRDIDEGVRFAEDDIFDEFGVNDVTTIEGRDVTNEPIPGEISRAERNLSKLTQAMKQGAINENTYWARVNSISRQLRSRYPGHRDYIDQKVSSIFGGKPQNQILSNMLSEAARASTEGSSEKNRYLTRWAKVSEDGALPPGFTPDQAPTEADLIAVTAPFYRDKAKREIEIAKLNLEDKSLASSDRKALESATDYALDAGVKMVTGVTSKFGKTYQELSKAIAESAKNKTPLTAEEVTSYRAQFAELKKSYGLQLEADLAKNYGSVLSPEDRKKAIDQGMSPILRLEEALVNKDVGALTSLANALEVQRTEDDRTLLYSAPEIRGYAALSRSLGPQAAEIFLGANQNLKTARDKYALEFALGNLYGDRETSVHEQQSDLVSKGKYTPEVGRALLNSQLKVIGDTRTPIDVRVKAARTLFGPKNANYIASLKREDALTAFSSIVSGETFKHMKDLRDAGYQGAWDDFVQWTNNGFGGVTKTYSDVISGAPAVVSTYNATTNQFDLALDPKEARNIPPGVPFMPAMNRIPQEVIDTQTKLNGAIRAMLPVLKEMGVEPSDYMSRVFGRLGKPENLSVPLIGASGKDEVKGDAGTDTLSGPSLTSRIPSTRERVMDALTRLGMNPDQANQVGKALEFAIGPMDSKEELALAGVTMLPGAKLGGVLSEAAVKAIGPAIKSFRDWVSHIDSVPEGELMSVYKAVDQQIRDSYDRAEGVTQKEVFALMDKRDYLESKVFKRSGMANEVDTKRIDKMNEAFDRQHLEATTSALNVHNEAIRKVSDQLNARLKNLGETAMDILPGLTPMLERARRVGIPDDELKVFDGIDHDLNDYYDEVEVYRSLIMDVDRGLTPQGVLDRRTKYLEGLEEKIFEKFKKFDELKDRLKPR